MTGRLDRGDGTHLAWARVEGTGPTIVFLPGFRSDMAGDKATSLAAFAAERGLGQTLAYLQSTFNTNGVMAILFLLAVIGLTVTAGMNWLEQHLLAWQ